MHELWIASAMNGNYLSGRCYGIGTAMTGESVTGGIAFLAVIGLCGGEVELSGVRTVSLTVFHLVAGDGT